MANHWDIDNSPGFWMHLAFNRKRQASVDAFKAAGFAITPEQWAVMVRLWQSEGRSQTEIANLTFRDRASVTRIIDALEVMGYCERRADPSDRRAKRVFLTEEGRRVESDLTPIVAAFVEKAYAGISMEERANLNALMQKVYSNLSE